MSESSILDEEDVRTLRQMLQWMRNFNVVGAPFENTSQGCTIRIPPPPPSLRQAIPKPNVVIQIESAVSSAGGKYTGTIYGGVMSDDGTGNLALPEGLTSGDPCLVFNQDEDGQPTHWGEDGSYAAGVYWGRSTEGSPRAIILCPRLQYRIASPQALSCPAPNVDSAATDSWDRKIVTSGNAYGDGPVSYQFATRMGYNNADANPVLGYFYRTKVLAADGREDSLSAETFVSVNTPDSCTT